LRDRTDIPPVVRSKLLEQNARQFYGI